MKPAAALLLLGILLQAQTEGPIRVDYACPAEDIEAFGLGCSPDDPCAVFLEIASVEAVGSKLFLTGNLHTDRTTLYGLLLASEDGGRTFAEPVKRLRSAALDQIEFLDGSRGWISGQSIEPLPRDPFLLLTEDGGTTWTNRPLFEEPRFGSIGQFWFDTQEHGELVLDSDGTPARHERYESNTGGASWELKESTKEPIHLKTGRNAGWRVRADGATKTFHVEKRAGSAWETVSRFVIQVAECK